MNVSDVHDIYVAVREGYPNARIIASSYEAYLDELEAALPDLPPLPVVTGEIGEAAPSGSHLPPSLPPSLPACLISFGSSLGPLKRSDALERARPPLGAPAAATGRPRLVPSL